MAQVEIAGQLNGEERRILQDAILGAAKKPEVVLEVGTWLGGGSTLHFLRALEQNDSGHLWGIEADPSIYDRMLENIRAAVPEAMHRFTPLFGLSDEVIPQWRSQRGPSLTIDVVFLDGGDNPGEQIAEFKLLDDRIPVGGRLLTHDAKLRKGRWLVPYVSALDHWSSQLHDISEEGLFQADKVRAKPSPESLRAANRVLRRLQFDPFEIAGAFLPRRANEAILRILPAHLIRRITQGRR